MGAYLVHDVLLVYGPMGAYLVHDVLVVYGPMGAYLVHRIGGVWAHGCLLGT